MYEVTKTNKKCNGKTLQNNNVKIYDKGYELILTSCKPWYHHYVFSIEVSDFTFGVKE